MSQYRILLFAMVLFTLGVSISGLAWAYEKKTESKKGDYHELAPGLRFGGSLRLRGETRDFRFKKEAPGFDETFLLTRIRLNLLYEPFKWLKMFVEAQDARIYFQDRISKTAVPNIFADALDLHQGFLDFTYACGETPIKLKVGRQKLLYGQQRLVGPLEWVNTARVFDAAKLSIGIAGERTLDLFASRHVPVDHHNFNDWSPTGSRFADSALHGIYYIDSKLIKHTPLELYWLLRHESDANDEVHTLGTRFAWKLGPCDADGEFAGQFGDFGKGIDQEAFAVHIGGGYRIEQWNHARFGVAYNFATGDDDPDDDKNKTFDNLFPTNHLHYGYMDLMAWKNMHNLELTAKGKWQVISLYAAFQWFWLHEEDTDAWYNAGGGQIFNAAGTGLRPDPFVGQELDLKAGGPLWDGRLKLEGGYSHFFHGDYLKDFGRGEDGDFAYLQMLVKF